MKYLHWLFPALIALLLIGFSDKPLAQIERTTAPSAPPIYAQLEATLPTLQDSIAETATASYHPERGVNFTADIIRPIDPSKPAHISARDWAIFHLETAGQQLALPALNEDDAITMNLRYYDHDVGRLRYLVIESDPTSNRYAIWLDGSAWVDETANR